MSPANGAFSTDGHVVIVGASLAGLRAAEALRKGGFRGRLTLVGDEPYEPYDRPPLSKQVLTGRVPAGVDRRCRRPPGSTPSGDSAPPAVGLDLAGKRVRLADGDETRLRPAADRDRNPGPALAQPGGGRAGRGAHTAGPG